MAIDLRNVVSGLFGGVFRGRRASSAQASNSQLCPTRVDACGILFTVVCKHTLTLLPLYLQVPSPPQIIGVRVFPRIPEHLRARLPPRPPRACIACRRSRTSSHATSLITFISEPQQVDSNTLTAAAAEAAVRLLRFPPGRVSMPVSIAPGIAAEPVTSEVHIVWTAPSS